MDKILYAGRITTVDAGQPLASAMAVLNGRIAAVGNDDEICRLATDHTEMVNLNGATVLPGFNDSHMHLMSIGSGLEKLDLYGATSVDALVHAGRQTLETHPELSWLLGRGWSQERFPDKVMPTRFDLDRISEDLPIYFVRVCGHVAVANTCALKKAGITAGTVPPAGGAIDFDADGEPTGVLRENALNLVARLLPTFGIEDYKRMFVAGAQRAASVGITSVTSDDIAELVDAELKLEALQELVAEGLFPLRYNIQARMSTLAQLERLEELRARYVFPSHTVEWGPMKLMCDGSLGGRTAALNEPYSDDPATSGVAILSQEQINALFSRAHALGWQVSAHAIGDRTMDMLLRGMRRMLAEMPKADARPRIIHAQITTPSILAACAELGVVCDIQPIFVANDHGFIEKRVGLERAKHSYAWKTILDLGIAAAGGSDAPVADCNPLLGIHAAVTRQDHAGDPPGGWLPEQRLSINEAIELFTVRSAYASFHETNRGTLSPGKLADFVVLSGDLTSVPPCDIPKIEVRATFMGGELVYGGLPA